MDFLCNLPAALLSANWKNLEFLENFGSRSCHVSQLNKILQLAQLHKNLTILAAAHLQLIRSCYKNLTWAPAPLREEEELRLHTREMQLENFGNGNFWKNWKNLGFRRPTSKLDVTRLKRK